MPVSIHLKRNGPLLIEAPDAPGVRIIDADGREIVPAAGKVIKFCRCGASAIKPFCDGSHKRVGFESDLPTSAEPLTVPAVAAPAPPLGAVGATKPPPP